MSTLSTIKINNVEYVNIDTATALLLGASQEQVDTVLIEDKKANAREKIQQDIQLNVANFGSILGTTADAVQLLAVQNMILLKAIADSSSSTFTASVKSQINDMAGSETAFEEFAASAETFLSKVKNQEILLPYLIKGGVDEVLQDVAERATGVAQILIESKQAQQAEQEGEE